MSELTKQTLLQSADMAAVTDLVAKAWPHLSDEEEQELCLEAIYELLAFSAPKPDNFVLLGDDQKAQHEIDVDMVLITIDFTDLEKLIFDNGANEARFRSQVGDINSKSNKKIYRALFG